ncbi:hypothetical protein CEXT_663261 [Caerostris extrusa]|uniref:Uncharacterized protein n=1 Tax=Caerostris extrusa TaxID=172846 RepID=A0AAV4T132_CAEEX|nr:hypothetical protein CEXT_663261 [Caerostris extrusa]
MEILRRINPIIPSFYLTTSFRKRSFHASSIRKTPEMRHLRDFLNTHRGMSYAVKSGGILSNHCPEESFLQMSRHELNKPSIPPEYLPVTMRSVRHLDLYRPLWFTVDV